MKIIGERVLVERIEHEKTKGFETVQVLDEFVSKGRIVQVGQPLSHGNTVTFSTGTVVGESDLKVGNTIIFAKFSPDTQEIKFDGKDMKVVAISDIIAIV